MVLKRFIGILGLGVLGAGMAAAEPPVLSLPLDCTLGETCFIQQFVDHDSGPDSVDFACGAATYDGHKGTDIRLPSGADMARGVAVLAAADGVVLGRRDGMADRRLQTAKDRAAIKGRECGNGVLLDHGDGWRTQYCHMKRGSIRVQKGQTVKRGTALGLVGLSGNTQFPHVHLSVEKDEQVIDPFQPQKVNECGPMGAENLWGEGFPADFTYQPTQIVLAGFAATAVKYDAVLDGKYVDLSSLARDKPLVAYGLAMNLRRGDRFQIFLQGPSGIITQTTGKPLAKNKAQWMSFAGKKAPSGGWPKGAYQSRISVLRAGKVLHSRASNYQIK